MRTTGYLELCGAAMLGLICQHAVAQYTPDLQFRAFHNASTSFAMTNAMLANQRANAAVAGDQAAESAATELLRFSPSASISVKTRQMIADNLAGHSAPEARAAIRKAFSTDAMWKEFTRLLKSYGYSSQNLADVMTAYIIISWEVVNGEDASSNAHGIRAVRQQLASALQRNSDLAKLSNADKQQSAEVMGYFATLAGASKNDYVERGDSAGLERLREMVHQSVRDQYGLDLKRLKLTSNGFVIDGQ